MQFHIILVNGYYFVNFLTGAPLLLSCSVIFMEKSRCFFDFQNYFEPMCYYKKVSYSYYTSNKHGLLNYNCDFFARILFYLLSYVLFLPVVLLNCGRPNLTWLLPLHTLVVFLSCPLFSKLKCTTGSTMSSLLL